MAEWGAVDDSGGRSRGMSRAESLDGARKIVKQLQGIRRETMDGIRVLGTERDSSGRRDRIRSKLRRADAMVPQLETILTMVRSGADSFADRDVAEEYERALRAYEETRDEYFRTEERSGAPKKSSHALETGDVELSETENHRQAQDIHQKLRAGAVDLAYELAQERNELSSAIGSEASQLREATADVATLIAEQEEDVEAVESGVADTNQSVKSGNADLESAIGYQKALRKKWCFCAIVIAIVLAAICIPILIHALPKS